MQNEVINSLIYIGVPIDAMIVSGLTDETPVEISATNGKIVIEQSIIYAFAMSAEQSLSQKKQRLRNDNIQSFRQKRKNYNPLCNS